MRDVECLTCAHAVEADFRDRYGEVVACRVAVCELRGIVVDVHAEGCDMWEADL